MSLAAKLPYDHPYAGGYPGIGSQPLPTDADALGYLSRVAAADGAAVEVGVAVAVDAFVKGCKADGIWDAIKSACIMCGARTLSGALVSLRKYGPELWDSSVTPTISDAGGSAGQWNADTLTMTNPSGGLTYFPIFTFGSIAATPGVQYRISGRFAGDFSHVSRISFGGADENNPASSQDFSFTLTAVSSASFAINLRGTDAPSSVRIESLSIKEVINDAENVANNFVEADYDRSGGGLKGDGSTKYLDSGRANDADGQNDQHLACYISTAPTVKNTAVMGSVERSPSLAMSQLFYRVAGNFAAYVNSAAVTNTAVYDLQPTFLGCVRSSASQQTARLRGVDTTVSVASVSPNVRNNYIFARNDSDGTLDHNDARLAFYSIGSALDLAALDNRVSTLVSQIAAAIP